MQVFREFNIDGITTVHKLSNFNHLRIKFFAYKEGM